MAQRYDVRARLAEGREAVAHTQTYVSACGLRGYRHPDLTAHGTQVYDWYDGEDGMDLWLLGDDCAELSATVSAAEEALRIQRAQLDELATAWSGPGADSAAEFLRRHCDTGAALVTGLRGAADSCAALRDELWRLVDDKAATAVAIDDRCAAQRPVWLAAAHAAASGERQGEDVVDHQVRPYVDRDIGGEWIDAMRSTHNAVAAAYDTAAAAARPAVGLAFPIPGGLGPRYRPDVPEPAPYPAPVTAPHRVVPTADPVPPTPDPVPPAAASVAEPPSSPPGEMGGLPGDFGPPGGFGLPGGLGLPSGSGGLGGLIPRITDAIGNLFGSPDDDAPGLDEPVDEHPSGEQSEEEPEPAEEVDETEPQPDLDEPVEQVAAEEPAEAVAASPADQQVAPIPPESEDPQTAEPEKTPCEIAADELPQVGE